MDKKIKILVVGDVCGRFNQLFDRENNINKKNGPFQMLLCVGEFFSCDDKQNDELADYKNGQKTISLPTYILGANSKGVLKYYEQIQDGVICTNLTYLGKRGLYTLSSGLRIAYLSGLEQPQQDLDIKEDYHFNKDDVLAVRSSCLISKTSSTEYRGIDILLTSPWPYINKEHQQLKTSKLLSYLCKEIRPRYHFCGLNSMFYEPVPYRTPADDTTSWQLSTRLICLANVGNINKEKYIYAAGLTPVSKTTVTELLEKTTNEIVSPFISVNYSEYNLLNKEDGPIKDNGEYFFSKHSQNDDHPKKGKRKNENDSNKQKKFMKIDPEICWFCLSCPDVEKHLVITIGEHFYLALAKGPVNEYHVLILSITHLPSTAQLNESSWQELIRFKNALKDCFQNEHLSICFTERNYKSSHLQINVFGVNESKADQIPKAFEAKAKAFHLDFEKIDSLDDPEKLPNRGPYFAAELPNGEFWLTRQMKHFPLHFARDVFCSKKLLNCEDKVNWRNCNLDKETEVAWVENFRHKFTKFDITN